MSPEAPSEYLTAAQVAALLQVSEKSVYRWAAGDPTFPMLRVGGTVRFPSERLMRWLRDREQGPARRRTSRSPMLSAPQAAESTESASPPAGDCANP